LRDTAGSTHAGAPVDWFSIFVIVSGPRVPVVPTAAPHRFPIVGPEPVRMVDVHARPRFITEWLDEDG